MSSLLAILGRLMRSTTLRTIFAGAAGLIACALALELALDPWFERALGTDWSSAGNLVALLVGCGAFAYLFMRRLLARGEQARERLSESEERFRSLTGLSADWFWETDIEHRFSWIAGGQPMLKLFGTELAFGRRLWEIPGIEVPAPVLASHLQALAAREPFHEFEVRRSSGGPGCEYHLIYGEPRLDSAGRFLGYRGVGRDITERKRAEQSLSEAKDRLELALEAGDLAVWDTDIAADRTYLDPGWHRLIGDALPESVASLPELLEFVHPDDRERARQANISALKGTTPSLHCEVRIRTLAGEWKWLLITGRVTQRDANGRAVRMTGANVDITRRKRAEQASRDAEARYRTLVELSPDGVLLQSDGLIEYANRAAAQLLGAAGPAALVGRKLLDRVHADDYESMEKRANYLRAGPGSSDFTERKMLRLDGREVMVEGASISYLERGRLVVQTVLRDITDRVRASEELAKREQRFRDIVEAAGEYVWETDSGFRYTYLSARVESVLGYMRAEMLGRRPLEFIPLGEVRVVEERLLLHLRRGEPFRDLVYRSITKSGRVIWQSVSGVPVFAANGDLKGFRGTGADITLRKQAEDRIQSRATRDALTHDALMARPNRRLRAERARQGTQGTQGTHGASRYEGRIAVLSLDFDRSKPINDSFAPPIDDTLLGAIAERLASALRKDDTLARLGRDQFVLLWHGTHAAQDAALVAGKVLSALSQPFVIEGRSLSVSASIGIGVYPGDRESFTAVH